MNYRNSRTRPKKLNGVDCHASVRLSNVSYQDDPVGYEQLLRAKLQPANLRGTMAFAGLYQITSEMIKHAVVERVRDFY
jgi:hypothetical protein